MSYVIQNFYNPARLVVATPRFKHASVLNNLRNLHLFLNMNDKIQKNFYNPDIESYHLITFLKFFFFKSPYSLLIKLDNKT